MLYRSSIGAIALATAMIVGVAGAQAHDDKKYPDFSGQWKRPPGIGNQYDISRPQRLGQVPPLTKEYQLIWEEGLRGLTPQRRPALIYGMLDRIARHWGTTPAEREAAFPGDRSEDAGTYFLWRGVDIAAPAIMLSFAKWLIPE